MATLLKHFRCQALAAQRGGSPWFITATPSPQTSHRALLASMFRRTVPSWNENASRLGGDCAPAKAVATLTSSTTPALATSPLNAITLGCASIAPCIYPARISLSFVGIAKVFAVSGRERAVAEEDALNWTVRGTSMVRSGSFGGSREPPRGLQSQSQGSREAPRGL